MERIFEFTVRPEELPCTLGEYLRARGFSRQIIIHLKKTTLGIQVNGQWAYVRTLLKEGDLVRILLKEEESSEKILPVPMDLDILYEDPDILVVNKPADTPVHPSIHNYENGYYRSSYPGKKCLQCFPPFFQYEKAGNPPDLSGNYPGNARSSQRHCRCAHCPGKRFCHPALCGL